MSDTLLPCPFCNKKLTKVKISGGIVEWAVHPSNDCVLSEFEFDYLPISAWNNRQPLWQPIATAPKDGTVVDLWWRGQRMTGCWWNITMEKWTDDRSGLFYKPDPSHWMPSPPDPK